MKRSGEIFRGICQNYPLCATHAAERIPKPADHIEPHARIVAVLILKPARGQGAGPGKAGLSLRGRSHSPTVIGGPRP
jgi:hypothetical protein